LKINATSEKYAVTAIGGGRQAFARVIKDLLVAPWFQDEVVNLELRWLWVLRCHPVIHAISAACGGD
jgi:hypothetical protein